MTPSSKTLLDLVSGHGKRVGGFPSVFCVREGDPRHPAILLLSGVHGDERSGPITLARMLVRGELARLASSQGVCIYTIPLLNKNGWDAATRESGGVDLNRSFLRPDLEVLAGVRALLEGDQFLAFLDLHEDKETPHPYIFSLEGDRFNGEFAAHMGCPTSTWEESPKWEGSSEGFARKCGVPTTSTTEVPPTWNMRSRVTWNAAAVQWFASNCGGV